MIYLKKAVLFTIILIITVMMFLEIMRKEHGYLKIAGEMIGGTMVLDI